MQTRVYCASLSMLIGLYRHAPQSFLDFALILFAQYIVVLWFLLGYVLVPIWTGSSALLSSCLLCLCYVVFVWDDSLPIHRSVVTLDQFNFSLNNWWQQQQQQKLLLQHQQT